MIIILVSKDIFALYQKSSVHCFWSWGSEDEVEFRAQIFPQMLLGLYRG